MSATSKPRGLVPLRKLGSAPVSHGITHYPIPSGYATEIGNGDPVVYVTSGSTRGTVARMNATVAATTITASGTWLGVLLGCSYTDPNSNQPVHRQHYPGGIVASDIIAHVCDDPDMLFLLQADGSLGQVAQGCNAAIIQTAVTNSVNGNSGLQLDASSIESTATLPLRIVDFWSGNGSAVGDAFTDMVVRLNTHFHRSTTGVASS